MTVDVISAIYGRYDTPRPVQPQSRPVRRWIMVTDDFGTAADAERGGWEAVVEPRPHLHPNVAAKLPKFRPDLYSDAELTVWIDGRAHPGATMVEMAQNALGTGWWGMWPHPDRTRLSDELVASRACPQYDALPLAAQLSHYLQSGYPDGYSLWATGCIIRRAHHLARTVGDAWLNEVVRWGFQDQFGFAYLDWQLGIVPQAFPGSLWNNPAVRWGPHG